ncbi:MAG: YveK family protein [Acidimicrobiia bacterium]
MEARRYLSIVRRRLLLIVAIVVAAVAAGWLITPNEDSYTATSTLYVGSRSIDISPDSRELSGDRVHGFDRLITTFTTMLGSRSVAQGAIDATEVERSTAGVVGSTEAVQVENANLIEVSVTDSDPATARALADGVANAFVDQLAQFEPTEPDAEPLVSVYEPAPLPTTANGPPLVRNLLLALIVGLVAAGAVVALLEHLDISLRSRDDVERHLGLPVLGVIPALGNRLPAMGAAKVRSRPARPTGMGRSEPVV